MENLQREWFGQKLCNCRYWQLQVEHPHTFFFCHSSGTRAEPMPDTTRFICFYACTSVWNEPLRFLLVTECLTFNPFFLHSNIVINRFRSDSSLPPGDSHLLDVGLTSPTCRFPPDLFLGLGLRKRESISMLSPRDGQALGQGLKEKPLSAEAWPHRQQHR